MINITDDEFRLLSAYIKEYSGIQLKDHKKTLLVGRLCKMLYELKMDSFIAYYKYLKEDKEGTRISQLIDKVTTNHTYFMREAEHFSYFNQVVLPYLKNSIGSKDLRIWCAASSTGEEPYTLAILLSDYLKHEEYLWDKKILATDLSLSVLEKARKGIYPIENLNSLPKIWRLNYFDKIGDNQYQVKKFLREEVIYRRFNLLEPLYPFKKKFHAIFCRNVMIYFDNDTKDKIIRKMYDSLENGGYLFIGHSESINRESTAFKYIKPAVYRKV